MKTHIREAFNKSKHPLDAKVIALYSGIIELQDDFDYSADDKRAVVRVMDACMEMVRDGELFVVGKTNSGTALYYTEALPLGEYSLGAEIVKPNPGMTVRIEKPEMSKTMKTEQLSILQYAEDGMQQVTRALQDALAQNDAVAALVILPMIEDARNLAHRIQALDNALNAKE